METLPLLTCFDDDTASRRREIERQTLRVVAQIALHARLTQEAQIGPGAPAVLDPLGGGRKDSVH